MILFGYQAAIGSVTSLATRLCAEAATGEALANLNIIDNVEPHVAVRPVGTLALKGLL